MWKRIQNLVARNAKTEEREEVPEEEHEKRFKTNTLDTWTYGMNQLALNEVEETQERERVSAPKEERIVGESV